MRILFISNDLIAGNLANLLVKEGHDLKIYIHEKGRRSNFKNLVTQTMNWRAELGWVGKDGLIIFDDIGYGKIQDSLRKRGYTVFGGSEKGDMLESNRQYAKEVFAHYGLKTKPQINIDTVDDAIGFIERNPGYWVIKQNGHAAKCLNCVGQFDDGRDIISVLKNYRTHNKYKEKVITLQERINGVEIGVGRYFNGSDWVGPIEINVEYKKMFPGDVGPTTSEMGTVAWYDDNENNKLFKDVLSKITPYLREADFRGDMEINCIVNEQGAFPLEATPRFGSPIVHLHSEIHSSPWGQFLHAVARGEQYELKWKKGFGLVVLYAVPPFPYAKKIKGVTSKGTQVFINDQKEDLDHIHFEEISKNKHGDYYISDERGYVLYITGMGNTVREAREATYSRLSNVIIPGGFYRNDIGLKLVENDFKKLKSWGYV
jgi:phosphoribosylamine---glycine ligase